MAAQVFQVMVGLKVGLPGVNGRAQSFFDDAEDVPGLVTERGRFGLLEAIQGGQADKFGLRGLAAIQVDSGQQQLAEHALGEEGRRREKVERPLAELECVIEPVVLAVKQGLVEIDGGDPGAIVLAIEEAARLFEELQGHGGLAVVSE